MVNAYWRTLLADQHMDWISNSAKRLCPDDFEDFKHYREKSQNEKAQSTSSDVKSVYGGLDIDAVRRLTRVHQSMLCAIHDRHLFVTTKGYIGVGHQEVYAGDLVCILFGGKTPFVLRHERTYLKEEGGAPFTPFSFFGAAYVHGIMDGEAMKDVNESNTLDFIIR